jgi:hypothetical protein
LQPEMPFWVRKDLELKLRRLYHTPQLQYITEIDSELSYSWAIGGGLSSIEPVAAKLWDSFQVTLSTDLAGGLQLHSMLTLSGISAQARFKLTDGTVLSTSLMLNLSNITGPWGDGPLQILLEGTQAILTNRVEAGVNVADLLIYSASAAKESIKVDRLLAPGDSVTIELPFLPIETYPVYSIQSGGPAAELREVTGFIEDIRTNVVFVNLINYANHSLLRLDLRMKIKEAPGTETEIPISEEDPVGEASFNLPLTTYLRSRTVEYQITKTHKSGSVASTVWLEWDLASRGNVIGLTWDLIQ